MGNGGEGAGRYRGTVPLAMPVPGWPWELVLIALDVWEGCFVLRGTSAFDLEDPFRSPGSWGITTNSDTTHTHQPRRWSAWSRPHPVARHLRAIPAR